VGKFTKNTTRPELEACLKSLREDDTLVVWRLDRLGRSLGDLIQLTNELQSRRIDLESLTEKLDTGSPTGKLVFHVFAALAEFEHNLIRERTLAGLKAARARGRQGGRPRKLQPAPAAASNKEEVLMPTQHVRRYKSFALSERLAASSSCPRSQNPRSVRRDSAYGNAFVVPPSPPRAQR
jgi:DNA invertase Pin-like site-specific DNA recombinase